MLKYLWFLFCGLCFSQTQLPVETHYFLSPGIKIGYTLGESGGFTYGFEVSYVITGQNNLDPAYGFVLDYDWFGKSRKLHLGVEFMRQLGGIDIGPTLVWTNEQLVIGGSVIPFFKFLVAPYINFSYLNNNETLFEVGTYLKAPIQTDIYYYNWKGGD
jgi:hypothetical protein